MDKSTPTVTIGPFARAALLRVYLWDITYLTGQTGGPYYSDRTPVNHALLWPSANPYTVHMADSEASGEYLHTTRELSMSHPTA